MSDVTINRGLIAFLFLLFVISVKTQTTLLPQASGSATTKTDNSARNGEAERLTRERRASALSLLISLASDAGKFSDYVLRARTQARIADTLWESDAEQGRALFRRAWDAAEIADKESGRGAVSSAASSSSRSREEVLRLAARDDYLLGEEFLGKLNEAKKSDAAEASRRTKSGPFYTPDEGTRQRLSLARRLLDSGDTQRAIRYADPALGFVSIEVVDFLSSVREKNQAAADQRYAVMLLNAQANVQSDIDTVSLLSSYIFTPHLYVTSQGRGGLNLQSMPGNLEPRLTAAFFGTATDILSRQLSLVGQSQDTSALEGQYPVINHLLQLFDSFGPKAVADALRSQLDKLTAIVPNAVRQRDDEWRAKWLSPGSKAEDREQSLLDQIGHAKTSSQCDQLYLKLALITAEKGDLRARDFAEKIEESELRKASRSYIDADLAIRSIEKKEPERALDLARTGELTHIQRVWILIQAAKLLAKSNPEKSIAVLNDAAKEARRVDESDTDRPRALMAVANGFLVADREQAWAATFDAVKAAKVEGFTGEDGQVTISIFAGGINSQRNISAPDFDLTGIFTTLAKADYERAVDLARMFTQEGPRASAVIAIAHSVLDFKDPQEGEKLNEKRTKVKSMS